MLILRDPELSGGIDDPDIRSLVEERFSDICSEDEYDPDLKGYMIVVETGDSVHALEKESGCPILRNLCNDIRFGESGFFPVFEVLEEHPACFEMVFVPGDGDFGIVIFIPKQQGIDPDLLAMCAEYAVPAP
jgi:predicted metal-dependent peptidase